ncbi:hypothetical protein AAG747_22755 [Rapidithrix thailandica]|uniref:Uncharacterized protein n=1 Tax=Rapidithrix thailandica TaxID=413964 RepID=A0AAW9SEG9_9BACT
MQKDKILGWYETLGGISGMILIVFKSLEYADSLSVGGLLMQVVFFCMYLYVMVSGIFLLKKKENSYEMAVFAQLIQVFDFTICNITYLFCAGASLKLHLEGGKLFFTIEPLLIHFKFVMGLDSDVIDLGINLIALIAVYVAIREVLKK